MQQLSDQAQRLQALDISQSFIVQAPAGSGKTGLLTQRFLALLAIVQEPEECLAITFTRKAAAEMRERILAALQSAEQNVPVSNPYAALTRKLAVQVLARDRECVWNLLENPNRLKIQTIDSLNVSLTKRMPVLSRFGVEPAIVPAADELYDFAVTALLTEVAVPAEYLPSLQTIMQHLDNNRDLAKKLLLSLLPVREQWLPYIFAAKTENNAKQMLEHSLHLAIGDILIELKSSVPPQLNAIPELSAFAAKNLIAAGITSEITACSDLLAWPGSDLPDLPAWLGIAQLCLTKTGEIRKTLTKNLGFPAPSSTKDPAERQLLIATKQHMQQCLELLANAPMLLKNLQLLAYLPPLVYSAQQWQFLAALLKILPLLVAQLNLVFREHAKIDLVEVALAATMALGDSDAPSDLALALDAKLSHILVDEFQDTAIAQFQILKQLIAGWTNGDGKTLFLVGDPMQSIYRFRQAEVALFLQAQQYGIAELKLIPLYLRANFRSDPKIVTWVNQVFQNLLPAQNNFTLGEVAYVNAYPECLGSEHAAVTFSCYQTDDQFYEAKQVAALVLQQQAAFPEQSIAILVRSRSHLPAIISEFKRTNIAYQGVEITPLLKLPIILDLLALTKALLHLQDRISWLAILRAPWCGLTLADLEILVPKLPTPIWLNMQNFADLAALSEDGKQRLAKLVPILEYALSKRDKVPVAELIQTTWQALLGESCVSDPQSLADLEVFFDCLRAQQNHPALFAINFFEQQLAKLFSKPIAVTAGAVQIMTIHKAKGLEFDLVILPGLGRTPRTAQSRLLRWEERTNHAGKKYLIMAPIQAVADQTDPIYKFLEHSDLLRNHYELVRLLYVATTRAKRALFGFACSKNCSVGSMLQLLGSEVQIITDQTATQSFQSPALPQNYWRLTTSAMLNIPRIMLDPLVAATSKGAQALPDLLGQRQILQAIGTVVHKLLWSIATFGELVWQQQLTKNLNIKITQMLQALGVPPSQITSCLTIVMQAISNTLKDPTGRWLLVDPQKQAQAEAAFIWRNPNNTFEQIIIDRSFVSLDSVRWIIDYKVEVMAGTTPKILGQYIQQLHKYRNILGLYYPNDIIKTALYFPLQTKFEVVI